MDTLAAVDPGAQAIGLIFNTLLTAGGFIALLLLRLGYNKIKHLLNKVDHIDECLDRTQTALRTAIESAQRDINEIKKAATDRDKEHMNMREEIAYLKAMLGVGLHEPIGEIGIKRTEEAPS